GGGGFLSALISVDKNGIYIELLPVYPLLQGNASLWDVAGFICRKTRRISAFHQSCATLGLPD
ncbi:hypothetical protein, partial [Pseudomonas avellanae]|uniref:hypothetical protein n=1 Tax=Pseudomonas avellanae TaxID=46257 RepID=UPI001ED98938